MSDNCLRQQTCLCYTHVHNYYDSWLSEAVFTLVPKHAQTKRVSKIISPVSSNCNCPQRQMLFFTNLYYSSRMWILWHLLHVRKVWSFNETLWSCQCECSIRKVITINSLPTYMKKWIGFMVTTTSTYWYEILICY